MGDLLQLSVKTVYRLVKADPIMPALKIGGTVRFPREGLERWLRSPEQGPPMRGRNLKEVQEILGHREFKMTLRYAHLSPDRLRDVVASLEDFSTIQHNAIESTPIVR